MNLLGVLADFVFNLFKLIGIILLLLSIVIIVFGLVGIIIYSIGYGIGYIIHLFVGPNIIYGMSFEQFSGIVFLISIFLTTLLKMKVK